MKEQIEISIIQQETNENIWHYHEFLRSGKVFWQGLGEVYCLN